VVWPNYSCLPGMSLFSYLSPPHASEEEAEIIMLNSSRLLSAMLRGFGLLDKIIITDSSRLHSAHNINIVYYSSRIHFPEQTLFLFYNTTSTASASCESQEIFSFPHLQCNMYNNSLQLRILETDSLHQNCRTATKELR